MIRCLVQSKTVETTIATQFVAVAKTIIDKCTATNVGSANETLILYLAPSGQSAAPSNRMAQVTIEPGKTYLCGEVVGHILEIGDLMAAQASGSIVLRASGRESTS